MAAKKTTKSIKKKTSKKVKKTLQKKSVKKQSDKNVKAKEVEPFRKADGRIDWERNNDVLKEIYLNYIKENDGKHPTITALCELSGFSRPTVTNHLKDFSFEKMKKGSKIKLLLGQVLESLANRCASGIGTAQDVKLLFQIGADWSEKSTVENINRYDYRALKDQIKDSDDLETQVKKINEFLLAQ